MKELFADTWFFIAWLDARDSHHKRVMAFLETYPGTILTTRWICVELANALSDCSRRLIAARFLKSLHSRRFVKVVTDEALYTRGLDLYSAREDKEWSLTDCISFLAMQDAGLTEALTSDHHFVQAGFRRLFE